MVLQSLFDVICWHHRVFNDLAKDYYSPDGVSLNRAAQYQLYRGYLSAILKAFSFLLVYFSTHHGRFQYFT